MNDTERRELMDEIDEAAAESAQQPQQRKDQAPLVSVDAVAPGLVEPPVEASSPFSVGRDPDGEPSFDIYLGRGEVLSVSAGPTGGIAWAWHSGGMSSHGTGKDHDRLGMALWSFLHRAAALHPDDEFHRDLMLTSDARITHAVAAQAGEEAPPSGSTGSERSAAAGQVKSSAVDAAQAAAPGADKP